MIHIKKFIHIYKNLIYLSINHQVYFLLLYIIHFDFLYNKLELQLSQPSKIGIKPRELLQFDYLQLIIIYQRKYNLD